MLNAVEGPRGGARAGRTGEMRVRFVRGARDVRLICTGMGRWVCLWGWEYTEAVAGIEEREKACLEKKVERAQRRRARALLPPRARPLSA